MIVVLALVADIVKHVYLRIPAEAKQTMGMPITTPHYWTVDDVWALPDDPRNRYEAVDGELLVTPAPRQFHQIAVGELYVLLRDYARATGAWHALMAPSDVVIFDKNLVQPDLFLTRKRTVVEREMSPKALPLPVLVLVVEVLSPSTARNDRVIKRGLYQRAAIDYWIVDVDARVVEQWAVGAERPAVCAEQVSWCPVGAAEALTVDVVALMARIHDEA